MHTNKRFSQLKLICSGDGIVLYIKLTLPFQMKISLDFKVREFTLCECEKSLDFK